MRGRSIKLVWLIGMFVLGFVLLKGGMHWYATLKLRELILEAAPTFTIAYADLDTSLTGRLEVNDISVVPVGQFEALKITQVAVQGPDVFSYLSNNNPFSDDAWLPESLKVFIKDLNMDLTGSLASDFDQNYQLSLQAGAGASAACTAAGNMSLGLLKDMGRKTLSGDGRLFYRYDEDARRLRGSVELTMMAVQSMSMELTLDNVAPQVFELGMPGMPWLTDFRLTMALDPAFGKEMSIFCADQTGKTVTEYEEYTAATFMQNLADNGIQLGRGLQQAVRSYYRNWGEIDIIIKPPVPLNLLTLMLRPPENIEETLGLQVAVNDQLLTDLGFTLNQSSNPFVPEVQKKKKAPVVKPRYRTVWKEIPPSQLLRYRDRKVRLYIADRPARKGILIGVEGDVVFVEQRLTGGKFTAHVPMRKIYRAEANVMVRTNPPSTPEEGETQ